MGKQHEEIIKLRDKVTELSNAIKGKGITVRRPKDDNLREELEAKIAENNVGMQFFSILIVSEIGYKD